MRRVLAPLILLLLVLPVAVVASVTRGEETELRLVTFVVHGMQKTVSGAT